jgi:hypothetical protein
MPQHISCHRLYILHESSDESLSGPRHVKKKVKLSLQQAVEVHMVVRRRNSHIFWAIGSQMAVRSALRVCRLLLPGAQLVVSVVSVAGWRIRSIEKSNDLNGNRTRAGSTAHAALPYQHVMYFGFPGWRHPHSYCGDGTKALAKTASQSQALAVTTAFGRVIKATIRSTYSFVEPILCQLAGLKYYARVEFITKTCTCPSWHGETHF